MTSGACTTLTFCTPCGSSARTRGSSPTRTTWSCGPAASSAPLTISSGALSPPAASTTTRTTRSSVMSLQASVTPWGETYGLASGASHACRSRTRRSRSTCSSMSLRDELDLGAVLDAQAAEQPAQAVGGGDGVGLDGDERHAALLGTLEHRGARHVVAGEHHGHGGRVERGEHDLGAVAADDDDLVGRELEVAERVLGAHGADHVRLDQPLAVALAGDVGAVQRLDDLGDGHGGEHGAGDERAVALDAVALQEARVLVA